MFLENACKVAAKEKILPEVSEVIKYFLRCNLLRTLEKPIKNLKYAIKLLHLRELNLIGVSNMLRKSTGSL